MEHRRKSVQVSASGEHPFINKLRVFGRTLILAVVGLALQGGTKRISVSPYDLYRSAT